MKKTFSLILFTLLMGSASADDNKALADKIYSFCKSSGGKVQYSPTASVSADGKVCVKSSCTIDSRSGDQTCDVNIDTESLPAGCARAALETCGAVVPGAKPGDSAGGKPGSGDTTNGGKPGSGDTTNGSKPGSGDTTNGSKPGSGDTTNGSKPGSSDTTSSTTTAGSGNIVCTTKTGMNLAIGPGHACYNDCKRKLNLFHLPPRHEEGLQRKSCIDCLMGHGYDFSDDVKRNAGVPIISGATVTVCKRPDGSTYTPDGSGSCIDGSSVNVNGNTVTLGVGGNGGSGRTTTTVIHSGGNGGGIGGGISGGITIGGGANPPSYCYTGKAIDEIKCREWLSKNGRFACSAGSSISACTGGGDAEIMSKYDISNCVNCQAAMREKKSGTNWAEVISAATPLLGIGLQAYGNYKSNQVWANAATTGFQQCQLDHNNYYQYLSANELPGMTPAQQQAMNCNGYSLGGYAGLQNPLLGGVYGAGYTPGFVGGMMGPYGAYNPYGIGGVVGGAVGGYVGGIAAGGYVGTGYPGIAGGYPAGIAGGLVNGISLAGGINGGYVGTGYPGVAGGYVAGGYVGTGYPGVAGGYVAGGYVGTGYPGVAGGYPAGIAGGLVNGISLAGGINGGYVGTGYPGVAGGYGIAGGLGVAGGYMAGGYTPGGIAGGYLAAGINGGYMAGGYMAGGIAGGGYSGGYVASQQAAMNDKMMQQQGISYQMGMGSGGGMSYGAGYGAFGASGYPMNMGAGVGINASFNLGAYH